MPKTNQITGKAYQTSLDGKIEDLKSDSAPTKNEKKIRKFDLDRRQKVNIKVQKRFAFLYRKI